MLTQRYVHVRHDVFLRNQQAVSKALSKEIFASVKLAVNIHIIRRPKANDESTHPEMIVITNIVSELQPLE